MTVDGVQATPAGISRPRLTRADCRIATTPEEIETHHFIRHQVFVEEQGLFDGSDVDSHDAAPHCVHILGFWEGRPVGTVRAFILDEEARLWQGDRLAVLPRYRIRNLGKPLVKFAVATAGQRGGSLMVAHIQLPNVAFFERIGWYKDGDVETYVGVEHQPMAIPLSP